MKIIIAGSRTITDSAPVIEAYKESGFEATEIVSGNASGVDQTGAWYGSTVLNIPVKKFKPLWGKLGKRAGFVRNQEMADYADALIAVWDGVSRGTADMIERAQKKGLKVYVKRTDNQAGD